MRFAVFGTGGVGGFIGGKLARSGQEVWFVARRAHLEAMKTHGLKVSSTDGAFTIPPGTMTDNLGEIGSVDVVLFCVKSYDTETAAQQLAPLLSEKTIIISLQNGVDNEEKIQRCIATGKVYGGLAYMYSTISSPGVVTETGGPKKFMFGPLNQLHGVKDEQGKRILDVMFGAGINAAYSEDINTEIWKKFVFIAAVGGLTALTRLTLGEILAVDETRTLLEDAMREVEAIAKVKGAKLEQGFIATIFETLRKFDNNTRSSLYHDLSQEKPMEIEALSGTVARYGKELGIATPIHRSIYASLLPYHLKHVRLRKGGSLHSPQ
jgi:2-dehydropantoate 2-reductase